MSTIKEIWGKAIFPSTASLQNAITNLEEVGIKIIMVVDQNGVFEGTVCDGDIRRGLLKGLQLNSPIKNVMYSNALVVPPDMDQEMVLQLMSANKIQQIPIINKECRIIGLHLWDELSAPAQRNNPMVIMAGGRGVRLRPHTENCPKPMLEIGNKPMLQHIIESAKKEGFTDFIISIHYLGEIIENYFGNGDNFGVSVSYLKENVPMGTAGALTLLDKSIDMPLVITNGDVITDISYGGILDFHLRQNAVATMAVRVHEWQHPYGVVETKGLEIVGFDEKPVTKNYINAGVYVLEPSCLKLLKDDEACDMPVLFQKVQENRKRVLAYPMHEPWLDVGRVEDLKNVRDSSN